MFRGYSTAKDATSLPGRACVGETPAGLFRNMNRLHEYSRRSTESNLISSRLRQQNFGLSQTNVNRRVSESDVLQLSPILAAHRTNILPDDLQEPRQDAHISFDNSFQEKVIERTEEEEKQHTAATHIQVEYRRSKSRRKSIEWKKGLKNAREILEENLMTADGSVAQEASETAFQLRTHTPRFLQYLLRSFGPHIALPMSHTIVRGAVAFVDMKGFTNLAEHISKSRNRGAESLIFIDESMRVDNSSEITNEILTRYWNLVVMYVNKFHGDVIKFLGDAVQIVFPIQPLFSNISDSSEAEQRCQDRALMFAIELMRALEYFEVDSQHATTGQLSMKIGLSFGDMTFRTVGGALSRCEFVLSGTTPARAAVLSGKASKNETVVSSEFTSINEFKPPNSVMVSYVRLRIGEGEENIEALSKRLMSTDDYFKLSLNLDPYAGELEEFEDDTEPIDTAQLYKLASHGIFRRPGSRTRIRSSAYSSDGLGGQDSIFSLQGVSISSSRQNASSNSFGSTSGSGHIRNLASNAVLISMLARFVPVVALSQIVVGCHSNQLSHQFCSILFVHVKSYDPDAPEDEQTRLMQNVTLAVQNATYEEQGDLRQVAVDDKGFVLISIFGLSAESSESHGLAAAWRIMSYFEEEKIKAGLGLTSGFCHFGPTGAKSRSEYAAVGSKVNLAARFMAKASSSIPITDTTPFSALLLDQTTLAGLPETCRTSFIASSIRVKGFSDPVDVYLTMKKLENLEKVMSPTNLTYRAFHFCKELQLVKVKMISEQSKRLVRRSPGSNFVADIFRMTIGLERPESVRDVLKYITVMGFVHSRINVNILESVIKSAAVRADVEYALSVIHERLQILRTVPELNVNIYEIRDVEHQIKPLYQTLMRSFRHHIHRELAERYRDELMRGHLKEIPREVIYSTIGTHFALAGIENHLEAAEFLNKSLAMVAHRDYAQAELLVQRSQKLIQSWRFKQQCKAEKAAAQSFFFLAGVKSRQNQMEETFRSYIKCLASYDTLAPLLSPRCISSDLCERTSALSIKDCSCCKFQENTCAFLFIHFTDDENAMSFHFRCLYISSGNGKQVDVVPWDCVTLDQSVENPTRTTNCILREIPWHEAQKRYQLNCIDSKAKMFYQILIFNSSTSKHIFSSFVNIGRITSQGSQKSGSGKQFRDPSLIEQLTESSEEAKSEEQKNEVTTDIPKSRACSIQ